MKTVLSFNNVSKSFGSLKVIDRLSFDINEKDVVGIIGPTRMDYKKVVPLVDYTGKVFSEFLTKMSK